jgi:peptidoglycan hydrolase-like protein with peptidoglycan-binding domain
MKYKTIIFLLSLCFLPYTVHAISPYYSLYTRNLTLGSKGQDVSSLQNYLISLNYLDKNLNTGYFGAMTKRALQKFQKDKGLPQTGFFGPLTRQKVDSSMNASTFPTVPSLNMDDQTWYISGREDAWVVFEKDKVRGKICNNFSGTLKINPDLSIKTGGDIVSTMMFCTDPEIQNLENLFHTLLKSESKVVVAQNSFSIVGPEGRISFIKKSKTQLSDKKDICTGVSGSWSEQNRSYRCSSYDISKLTEQVCTSMGGSTYTSCGSPVSSQPNSLGNQIAVPAVCVAICDIIK